MRDELVFADSAGHTMIDVLAARAADRERRREAEPAEEEKTPAKN